MNRTTFTNRFLVMLFVSTVLFSKAQTDSIQVVFHVLHHGGVENIADSQIVDAIRILNEDYNKLNADTADVVAPFKSIIGNANIQFKLASTDPQGNPTTGIDRIYTSYITAPIADSFYLNQWNPAKYLNVWTIKQGVVNPPATLLPASADSFPERDGIVMGHSFIGSIGTGKPYNSRSLTHDVGHYLNLLHTWGNGNPNITCGDDSVSDTPITKGSNLSCNLNLSECTNGVIENVQNFMDYSYCSRMFTVGQAARMNACLNSSVANRDKLRSTQTSISSSLDKAFKLSVMPNPFSNAVRVSGLAEGSYRVAVFDVMGQQLVNLNNVNTVGQSLYLELSDISARGIYILSVSNNKFTGSLRLLKE